MSEQTLTECRMLAEQLAKLSQEQERRASLAAETGLLSLQRYHEGSAEKLRYAADALTAVLNPQTLRAVK